MTPERWQKVKGLLGECANQAPDELPPWLDAACGDDTLLRREVEALLAYEQDLGVLSVSPASLPRDDYDPTDDLGRRIGPYRVREILGRGGMGTVYLADREEGFEQEVALKLINGLESLEGMRRFHRERQILARLKHPNIAHLLDGGMSEDGRSFFAMERVEGVDIDRHCGEHRLSVRSRLELVVQVCDALQAAHRSLVVHRDLKPSNILVTDDGTVKLLDFGIATSLQPDPGDTTEHGQPMTLYYASPEQFLDEPITAASDIYSLGVVLYELLTGRLPCGLDSLGRAEAMRAVCETVPLPPGDAAVTPARLHRQLRGDIDAIVLKALHKEPAQRYASVEQLAADLRRHFDELPVLARRSTLTYRTNKFCRRNRWGLAAATVALVMLLAFTAVLARQLDSTKRQRLRAERVSTFLVDLFRGAEPDRGGRRTSVHELIDIGRGRLETELTDEPEIRAELLATLGQVYQRLGHFDDAQEALEASINLLERHSEGDHPKIARTLNDLAVVATMHGEYPQAEKLYRKSIAMRQRLGLEEELIKPRNNLAMVLMVRGELAEAEAIYREGLRRRRALHDPRHPNIAQSLRSLATVLYQGGHFDDAEPLLYEALDIRTEVYGRDSTAVASVLTALARLAHAQGDLDAADSLYVEALDTLRRRLGDDHLRVATVEKDLAALCLERDELATASVLLSRVLTALYRHKDEGDWMRADAESLYGDYLARRGHFDAARGCLTTAYDTLLRQRGPDALTTREAHRRLTALDP
jgi:tetratricopeptide (TPR) repeat protein